MTKQLTAALSPWKTLYMDILAAVCWGIATKGTLPHAAPLPPLFVQLIWSNLLLWSIVGLQELPLPPVRQAVRVGSLGLLQPGLSFSTAVVGLSLTQASVEALIWSLETAFVVGLAWLLLRERVGLGLLALSGLCVLGVGLVTVSAEASPVIQDAWLGNLLVLLGTFCAALYTVLARRNLSGESEPLMMTALNQAVGLLGIWGLLIVNLGWGNPGFEDWTGQTWLLAAVSGVMLHTIPFWLFNLVLKQVSASLAAFFLLLVPLVTISGAYLFLGESLTLMQGGHSFDDDDRRIAAAQGAN